MAESAAHLALRLSLRPPAKAVDSIRKHAPGTRLLMHLCAGLTADRTQIEPLTYLDEMENLFRDVPHEEVTRLFMRRFDESEDVGLEALALGGGDSMEQDPFQYFNEYT